MLTGPFAGMRYPAGFVPRQLFGGPYQVGSFELELHPAIERIVAARPSAVVNVGCGRGLLRGRARAAAAGPRASSRFELDPALRDRGRRARRASTASPTRLELRGALHRRPSSRRSRQRRRRGGHRRDHGLRGSRGELADPERGAVAGGRARS